MPPLLHRQGDHKIFFDSVSGLGQDIYSASKAVDSALKYPPYNFKK